MASFVKISLAQQIVQRWKNGRGETHQIAISPAGGDFTQGAFDWRVSHAVLTEDGPFSNFPEFERHLVLLEGSDLELVVQGSPHYPDSLFPGRDVVVQFAGELSVNGILRSGPVRDLNIFCKKDRCHARVQIIKMANQGSEKSFRPNAPSWLLLAADGPVKLRIGAGGADSKWSLERGETLLVENWDPQSSVSAMALSADSSADSSPNSSADVLPEWPGARLLLIEILPLAFVP